MPVVCNKLSLKISRIQMSSDGTPRVTGLNKFPIKSCRALCVDEIELDSYGVVDDRRFMLVDGNGRFISQRKFSQLATVSAHFEQDGDKRFLCVSSPKMSSDLKFEPILEGDRVEASVWESHIRVLDQGDIPAGWFNELIGHGSSFHRLVACAENDRQPRSEGFVRFVDNLPPTLKQKLPPMKIALADAGPVSLVSHESLEDVNERLKDRGGQEVPLNRFRINIEISGCAKAFEEDDWLLVRIGSVPFLAYTNAERCKMTGIDQTTGEHDKLGPLEILRSYRAPRGPAHAMFGQLLIPLQAGKVRVGDIVQVLEKKKS